MSTFSFDIRTLETAVAADAKVNFDVAKLATYKETFAAAVVAAAPEEIVLTGPGPAWLHLALWHEAHGRVQPGAIWFDAPGVRYAPVAAGEASGDGSTIVDGRILVAIGELETAGPDGRVSFDLDKVAEYQKKVLERVPAFKPGAEFPEFEVILTGAGPIWLFLGLAAALHSRGGKVVYSAPNAPRVVVVDHN